MLVTINHPFLILMMAFHREPFFLLISDGPGIKYSGDVRLVYRCKYPHAKRVDVKLPVQRKRGANTCIELEENGRAFQAEHKSCNQQCHQVLPNYPAIQVFGPNNAMFFWDRNIFLLLFKYTCCFFCSPIFFYV